VLQELSDERHFPGMQPVAIYPIDTIVQNGRTMLLSVGNLLAAPTLVGGIVVGSSLRKMVLMKGHSKIETPAVKGRPRRG
jgi:hypothetical protein